MLLSALLYFLPAAAYRYLPERLTVPFTYLGTKIEAITGIQDFPHHVLIVYGSRYCSGSLIYSKIVVTAASCFTKINGEAVIVKLGSNTLTGYGELVPVVEYKIHEYFKQLSALDNDIALLILVKDVIFRKEVMKTILVEPEVALHVNVPVLITGWSGTNVPVKYLNSLIKLEAVVLNQTDCKQYHGNLITPSNFCVKYTSEQTLNDNGGGAVFDELLVGILSIGFIKRDKFNIAILTNVSYFHRWITLNSKRFLKRYCTVQEEEYTSLIKSDETYGKT